ncbi:hypothetical protein XA68_18285 [Ophiocordyceps unilateralis]|uniref:Fungal lipase-type domain-containing protein n=1 Tax=Ophiocordyceps unilateralis TaxID=268505 RepID=A0A2A9PJL0_OPHUN|nr:hypothetical protein XA68_18285 [Ophiocordyceps unilateralis]
MGFFSGRNKPKPSSSFSDPPNVYFNPPPRLPTATSPPIYGPYPTIYRPVPLTPVPPPGWVMIPSSGPGLVPMAHHQTGLPQPWLLPAPAGNGSIAAPDHDMIQRFDRVLTLIDREQYSGQEAGLFLCQASPDLVPRQPDTTRRAVHDATERPRAHDARLPQTSAVSVMPVRYLAKVELYINSKLPTALPPLTLDTSIWPLLCLAAQCSLRVYSPPSGLERRQSLIVPADRRSGSKAMYIRSVPADAAGTVVLAVRGTASFADWAVNLRAEPAEPKDFLDDSGNACHAGFLSVARAMVRPAAARLRRILRDDPARAAHSLVLTGHSAGGAVAALLYMHMVADNTEGSELARLAACFRRVHCVTFGAPPVSLLPLTKPSSIFLSFVNEGDPVARADKAYVKSLLALLASPGPVPGPTPPFWPVPPSTLSNAGRIVVLRRNVPAHAQRGDDSVEAVTCRDDQLRGVVWGDPVCHLMSLYASRIETLAAHAVAVEIP